MLAEFLSTRHQYYLKIYNTWIICQQGGWSGGEDTQNENHIGGLWFFTKNIVRMTYFSTAKAHLMSIQLYCHHQILDKWMSEALSNQSHVPCLMLKQDLKAILCSCTSFQCRCSCSSSGLTCTKKVIWKCVINFKKIETCIEIEEEFHEDYKLLIISLCFNTFLVQYFNIQYLFWLGISILTI